MIYWTAFSLPYNIALKRRMPSSVDTPYIQYQWDRRVNSLSRKRSPHFKRWNDFPILYCMIIRRCQSIAILSDQNVIFIFLPSKAATRTKCDWFCFCHQIILHLTSFRIANVLKTKKQNQDNSSAPVDLLFREFKKQFVHEISYDIVLLDKNIDLICINLACL